MNRALRTLVAEALAPVGATLDWAWSDDLGPIPEGSGPAGDFVWNRGFNLLLIGAGGRPRYFCKCRPPSDVTLNRATMVQERLHAHPDLRRVVPWARGAVSDQIQLQITAFVPGRRFDLIAPALRATGWAAALREIVATATLVSRRAASTIPELLGPDAGIDIFQAAAPLLSTLRGVGLASALTEALAVALRAAGRLPRELQHGDLWPNNVIRYSGSWWLVDFEVFGDVQVPLYDVCHLARSTLHLQAGTTGDTGGLWQVGNSHESPAVRTARSIIWEAAVHRGLQPAQALGAAVYYAMDFAVRLHRRGTPQAFWQPYFGELEAMAGALRSGVSLAALVSAT